MNSNLDIVKALYVAFGERDHEAIRRIFHPRIVWVQNEGFPGGGTHVGADTVLDQVFAKFRCDWAAWQAVVAEWLDAGGRIIVLGEYRGTHKATGRSMTAAFAHVYTLEEGRIVKFQQYADTRKIAGAMSEVSAV